MSGKLNHRFQSGYSDAGDATKLRPSNWNDSLVFSEGAHHNLAMRDTGAADGWSWTDMPTLTRLTLETAAGAAVPAHASNLPTLLLGADLLTNAFIEIHNRHAFGIDLYTHHDTGFKAPYISLYKSRGSQAAPTPPTVTGYELDSIGGINFGGYSGVATNDGYEVGCAILTQVSEDWAPGGNHHAAFISIYGSSVGGTNVNQLIQFGGLDPSDLNARNFAGVSSNIISYRPISFNGNSVNNPLIKPVNTVGNPKLQIRNAPDTLYADLDAKVITAINPVGSTGISAGTLVNAGVGFAAFADVPFEAHTNFANGIHLYTHSDTAFRAPSYNPFRSRGTQALPTAVLLNDQLAYYNALGYDGSAYQTGFQMVVRAAENWTGSARGTFTQFFGIAVGSTTLTEVMRIQGEGVGIGAGAAAGVHLQLGAGSTSRVPLRFVSGTVATTPLSGAVEMNGDDLFWTIVTGAARKRVVLTDGAALTSGKIPRASTNGRLIDGPTPALGTNSYFVATGSGGAVTKQITFTDGILTGA